MIVLLYLYFPNHAFLVVSGLKYLHVVKRKGIKMDKMEEMMGSYGPSADTYEKKFLPEEGKKQNHLSKSNF